MNYSSNNVWLLSFCLKAYYIKVTYAEIKLITSQFHFENTKWVFGLRVCASTFFLSTFFFFFFLPSCSCWPSLPWIVFLCTVHEPTNYIFLATFSLKMGPTVLFTHLKIISLQCFQFQFSVSAKISSIQTDPKCVYILSSSSSKKDQ